jgi:hypothetical protein
LGATCREKTAEVPGLAASEETKEGEEGGEAEEGAAGIGVAD